MRIIALKPGHDGTIACIDEGKLEYSLEAEKDNFPRYASLSPSLLLSAFSRDSKLPEVVAINGYVKGKDTQSGNIESGYLGVEDAGVIVREQSFFGKPVKFFSSTHERSHIFCSYGLSDLPEGAPFYALVWEGIIGNFYRVDEKLKIEKFRTVLPNPGTIYSFLYALADPTAPLKEGYLRYSNPGKLMALAAYSDRSELTKKEAVLADQLFGIAPAATRINKSDFKDSPYFNIGVEHEDLKQFAGKFSDLIFKRYLESASNMLTEKLPLVIGGGCGLNCEWNSKWSDSGLFSSVFVPPVTNDSGCAIGTAIDANQWFGGSAKLDWSVFAGEEFQDDTAHIDGFSKEPLDLEMIVRDLSEGKVIAWVQGRAEIGPRALGHRSLIAAPFSKAMQDRLNRIKKREPYRPVAPICRVEEVGKHFDWNGPSPYMLYFQKVKSEALQAVTHVDGTARVQTVSESDNLLLHQLLTKFGKKTGFGVLCNTSLNFPGFGFINRTSDLMRYCLENDVDAFVANDRYFKKQ